MALLVMSLGLSRFLVVCTGPHCHGQIELAHVAGSCCDHDHEAPPAEPAPADDLQETAGPGHGTCVDDALGIDDVARPEHMNSCQADLASQDAGPAAAFPSLRARAVAMLPPTTGPPRTDQRTALLATTTLLL